MHIAMYADRPASFGGIETHVAALAKALLQMGQRVTIAFSRILHPEVFAPAVASGARLLALDKSGVVEFCRRESPDVLHAHSHGACVVAERVSRLFGIPWLATLHGPGQSPVTSSNRPPFAVICVSHEIARSLSRRHRVVVIENGVDLARFTPARRKERRSQEPVRALYLGRVGPSKTQGVLALQEALGSRSDVELRFVSTWAPKGLGGPTERVDEALGRADLVFATGRGVREAMACGCAAFVLGAFSDGLVTPDTVDRLAYYNFSGRATRQPPTAKNIAFTVRSLLRAPEERARLSRFGAEHAARAWDVRVAALHTLETYLSGVS